MLRGALAPIWETVVFVLASGLLSFFVGQALPRRWFDFNAFPYRDFPWEDGGRVYSRLNVRAWKDKLPDMSRIMPFVVKKKALLARTPEAMARLIRETCVAEIVHWGLIVLMSPVLAVWQGGVRGALFALFYAAGNLLFIIIQRYNRPRLKEVLRRMEGRRAD
ncbi:MAG: hypothetical protein ACOYI5_08860 [Christensenellales bacterium]|jgi:glycosyl-4,4'-diaponeurosporenoate acyltransferase